MWSPVDFRAFYARHEFLSEPFEKSFGISLAAFSRCVMALWGQAHVDAHGDEFLVFGLVQRAYSIWSTEDVLIDRMMAREQFNVPDILASHKLTRDECLKFFELHSWNKGEVGTYSLDTPGPRKLVIPTSLGGVLIDYSALAPILFSVAHWLGADWSKKGRIFEDHVIEMLSKSGAKLWECQKELEAHDGSSKEINVSFVIGEMLLVCELKSITRSSAYETGESGALEFRKLKMLEALQESNGKVVFLICNPVGQNYALPDGVTSLVPFVASPFVEYIWSVDPEFWMTDEIPRVCTPKDLVILSQLDPGLLKVTSFAREFGRE